MILEIVKYGHPALRQKGRRVVEINDETRELASDMLDTMRAANGVGLAAQQVGVPLQLTVIDVAEVEDRPSTLRIGGRQVALEEWMPMVLLNPVLELSKQKEVGVEGCLSFPEITADIQRSASVRALVTLIDGRELEFEASGLLARALQHEVDHLNGILFIDRMNSAAKAGIAGRLKRMQKETLEA
jgi:peptide deformylase